MKESTRQKKFNKLIQKELSEIFQWELSIPSTFIITPTVVRSSPDLLLAKIFISVFPDEKMNESLALLEGSYREIRKHLGRRIGKQVRYIPELKFFADDSQQYAEKIESLFQNLQGGEEGQTARTEDSEE